MDERDRLAYLRMLGGTVRAQRWRCLAYCLMPNHVHLLVETPLPNLGRGMQRLHGPYAQEFNKRHGFVGHLFQGRYGAARIRDDDQLVTAVRYVVLNPVAAGLCGEPAEWPWSSHAAIANGAPPPWLDFARLLWHLEGLGRDQRRLYAELTRTSQGTPVPIAA